MFYRKAVIVFFFKELITSFRNKLKRPEGEEDVVPNNENEYLLLKKFFQFGILFRQRKKK